MCDGVGHQLEDGALECIAHRCPLRGLRWLLAGREVGRPSEADDAWHILGAGPEALLLRAAPDDGGEGRRLPDQ